MCYRGPSEGVSIDVLESTLVVPVIEGVRDPPFGIAFPTDLVIVANGTRRERSATCATDAAPAETRVGPFCLEAFCGPPTV